MNIEILESPIHGTGVFAREMIEVGEWQYIYGYLSDIPTVYGFEHSDRVWWEPFAPFRYLNHSNTPNCEVSSYDDDSTILTTLRDLEEGEELTIDYGCGEFDECSKDV
jgi:hypothetical protein